MQYAMKCPKTISILTFFVISLQAIPTFANTDRDALVSLYNATNGPNWTNDSNWLSSNPVGDWYGVYTDKEGRVVQLFLNNNNLSGVIPTEIGNLTKLKRLHLYGNKLTGSIPPSISNLIYLRRLWLDGNDLKGAIPSELGKLPNLTDLTVSNNQFRGELPETIQNLPLNRFWWYDTGFCIPQTPKFDIWLGNIVDNQTGFRCPSVTENPTWVALVALFNSTNGDNWNRNKKWHTNAPLSSWEGVVVDAQDQVIGLDLSANNLVGTIPSQLGDIVSLTYLRLSSNELSGSLPSAIADLYNLEELDISDNKLSGTVPSDLGGLTRLLTLQINDNEFIGRIHQSFLTLNLEKFWWDNAGVCIPDTTIFNEWLNAIQDHQPGRLCPVVTSLELVAGNGQSGQAGSALPRQIVVRALDQTSSPMVGASISFVTGAGHGSVDPIAVTTDDSGEAQTEWTLGVGDIDQSLTITSNRIQLSVQAHALYSERKALEALYNSTGGHQWNNSTNWNNDRTSLDSWHGVTLNQSGRVSRLRLVGNKLLGSIPPAIGALTALEELNLGVNQIGGNIPIEIKLLENSLRILILSDNLLEGEIPVELSRLASLEELDLSYNQFEGSIPNVIGSLLNLEHLNLSRNYLSGSIPGTFWRLEELNSLNLSNNRLSGSIPSWFGDRNLDFRRNLRVLDLHSNKLTGPLPIEISELSELLYLFLRRNDISGTIPHEYSSLGKLQGLDLSFNPKLSGNVPRDFTQLNDLRFLLTVGTAVCAPHDDAFQSWLVQINYTGKKCAIGDIGGDAYAYMIQNVKDVHLVYGEPTFLRVFVSTDKPTNANIPFMRARFFRNGSEIYRVEIPAGTETIPTKIDEGNLRHSANAVIPALPRGVLWFVEIDPHGRLDPNIELPERWPPKPYLIWENYYHPPQVKMHLFALEHKDDQVSTKLHVRALRHDSADFDAIQQFLPIRHFSIGDKYRIHVDTRTSWKLLKTVKRLRKTHNLLGSSEFAMGFAADFSDEAAGRADRPGNASVIEIASSVSPKQLKPSYRRAHIMVHELGHNLNLKHAPGWKDKKPSNIDSNFPHPSGHIGDWGYKWTKKKDDSYTVEPIDPNTCDFMTYCFDEDAISEYHWEKAYKNLKSRKDNISNNVVQRSLLISGDVSKHGSLSLDPVFSIEAIPSPPQTKGPYTLSGFDSSGKILFSYPFNMTEWPDGEGNAGFVFTIPVENEWSSLLKRISLSGPSGTVSLRDGRERPMVIARDHRTGQIRAILTELDDLHFQKLTQQDFDKILPEAGLDAMISRGLPSEEDWYR